MNSRENLVAVIDERGVKRLAKVICKFSVGQRDYMAYSIGRDRETDNIFVSKLVRGKNEVVMANIVDEKEKAEIDNVIKELIRYADSETAGQRKNNEMNHHEGGERTMS